ncbi:MAG: ComEC/Rec2 family competence protein [Synergistaceae bacterium]|jgi:competence protein ComEC|nr:ComEC/Rec2 family competence protein [Synergistaceae bacterium]
MTAASRLLPRDGESGRETLFPRPGASPLANAPAFILLLAFSIFLFLRIDMSFPFSLSLIISLIAAAGWTAAGTECPNKRSAQVWALLSAAAVCGFFFLDYGIAPQPTAPSRVESRGVVLLERKWGFGRVALVSDSSAPGRYLLRLGRDAGGVPSHVSPGDVVSFSGAGAPFRRADERGGFDEFLYWRARGALFAVENARADVIGRSFGPPLWRNAVSARIREALPPRTAGYMLASWVGERDQAMAEFHRAAGTSHLLAVSGLHVGVVYAICWFLLKGFKFRLWAISAVLWFYVFLTGASPSSVRAAAMIQIVILGRILGCPSKPFNSVSAAGSAMLLHNPWLFWDVGWRLSMLAVLTLTSIYSFNALRSAKYIAASPMVWFATSLQAARTFGPVPLAGIAINFFAVPAFGVLLPGASIFSLPAMAGVKFGYQAACVAESFFWAWEKFSDCLLFLCPWTVDFGVSATAAGAAALTVFFALGSGFSSGRAMFAALANAACLFIFISAI